MKTQTIHIRNMCCQRCIDVVLDELKSLGLKVNSVKLGTANYASSGKVTVSQIEATLGKRGFALIRDEEVMLVEKIKTKILDLVHRFTDMEKSDFVLAAYLEEQIGVPYRSLKQIFSQRKNLTIEKYFILLKIEKIKDMVENSNLLFSEIAYSMGYNSHQHLSAQFKKETGMTMHDYKKSRRKKRKLLETI